MVCEVAGAGDEAGRLAVAGSRIQENVGLGIIVNVIRVHQWILVE